MASSTSPKNAHAVENSGPEKDWFRVLTVPLLDEAESITSVSLVELLEKRLSKRFPCVDVCVNNQMQGRYLPLERAGASTYDGFSAAPEAVRSTHADVVGSGDDL